MLPRASSGSHLLHDCQPFCLCVHACRQPCLSLCGCHCRAEKIKALRQVSLAPSPYFHSNFRLGGKFPYLSRHTSETPLKIDDIITTNDGSTKTVKDVWLSLHPEGQPADPTALLDKALLNALPMDPVMFECLNGNVSKNVALHSKGSAVAWRRMCSSYKEASLNLCEALARVARRICTTMVPPDGLGALLACRLVPLNKNPLGSALLGLER